MNYLRKGRNRILKHRLIRGSKAIDQRNGMLFVLPWFIGFLCFILYPALASLYYSFCDYGILTNARWIGIENFRALFTEDNLFWVSLYNTIYYTAFSLPIGLGIAVTFAMFLNMKVKGLAVYRTIYYLPTIVPVVASSVLWMWILNPQYGLLNALLGQLGLPRPGWIADPEWSKLSLVLMSWWGLGGAVLLCLAALQDVPQQLYESAELDGANWWDKSIHITVPMITPVIFFNFVMGLINSFQYFTQVYIMTGGGPANSTLFYSLYLYRNAFTYFKMGYASALSWLLFSLVLFCTLLIFKSSRKWVYYAGKVE